MGHCFRRPLLRILADHLIQYKLITFFYYTALDDIKEKVTPELFTLHICMNMVGNWQCDGWWYIICEQVKLVPDVYKRQGIGFVDGVKEGYEYTPAGRVSRTIDGNGNSVQLSLIHI